MEPPYKRGTHSQVAYFAEPSFPASLREASFASIIIEISSVTSESYPFTGGSATRFPRCVFEPSSEYMY